jgi:hypothetical protein
LEDEERALVLGVLLEEVLAWVRSLPGSQRLRALVVFDEVYGFLPPHSHNPPTKGPLVALMKQARAFGVGVLISVLRGPMTRSERGRYFGRLVPAHDVSRGGSGRVSLRVGGSNRGGDSFDVP